MPSIHRFRRACAAAVAALALAACGGSDRHGNAEPPEPPPEDDTPAAQQPPNILLVIMDDVGIDQMSSFGYGGATAPSLPNIDAVAAAGLRFRNAWGMPVCSPSRAAILTGRYPLRTGIEQAIGPSDLANSQLSPHEVTAPRLLREAGYESGMFGKFHLAGPDHNQAGNATPRALGWDHFEGWIGLPGAIDTTAGGIAPEQTYACGFVPGAAAGGAEAGACHYADNTCQPMRRSSAQEDAPGLQCLASGGIFAPGQSCESRPATLDFNRLNAYYVSPLVVIEQDEAEAVPLADPRARGYRTRIEADAAIRWINARPADKPWMATVAFTAAHTPLQQPPSALAAGDATGLDDALDCNDALHGRVLQNRMTEALDHEFGRLLVETGLATRNADGTLRYQPERTDTVIVVVTDNGTLGYSVKLPFNGQQAKGTAYQTGVWVPLIVAGPQVAQPGRAVEHMVNQTDLFQLFGELAGIDVHEAVPRTVDSAPLLPYLADPEQGSLRSINFTMTGYGVQANGARNGPCVVNASSCTQIPVSKSVCEDNQGVWWGAGYTDESVVPSGGAGYPGCAEVNQALHRAGQATLGIQPDASMAIRDTQYKLIRNTVQHYDADSDTVGSVTTQEFYRIDQATPVPLLDDIENDLLAQAQPLSDEARRAHDTLAEKLDTLLASQPDCPGDGNQDGVVDARDVANWSDIARQWGRSSVYDFPVGGVVDGLTDHVDGAIVQQNLGRPCPALPSVR